MISESSISGQLEVVETSLVIPYQDKGCVYVCCYRNADRVTEAN